MKLSFDGLYPAPAQVWGAVRLVPLLREDVAGDLRLAKRVYPGGVLGAVVEGRPDEPGLRYYAWVPHGLVLNWTRDGAEVATGHVEKGRGGKPDRLARTTHLAHRMVKREGRNQLRILPLHLAMEGLLSLYFNGPEIAWPGYAEAVLRRGLSPRVEWSLGGRGVPDLSDALGLFEILAGQVGVLVFVGDALGAAFVTPHPSDYRALHGSLIEDFFGRMLAWYGLYDSPPEFRVRLEARRVSTLADLRAELARQEQGWADFRAFMASGLMGREVDATLVRRCGPFQLHRFLTRFEDQAPDAHEHHIGEVLLRGDGQIEYLKTMRLSRGQIRRVRILRHLAAHDWHLPRAMKAWTGGGRLDTRMRGDGLGYMLDDVALARVLGR
ncbi:MAG: hypothetical protein H6739_32255 [Alphaproteobacteria bacterium]|nr:hypothetical protein [Alphaproteobacteria bacterium]